MFYYKYNLFVICFTHIFSSYVKCVISQLNLYHSKGEMIRKGQNSGINEPQHDISNNMVCATSKGSEPLLVA